MKWPKWHRLNRRKKKNFIIKCLKELDIDLDDVASVLYLTGFCSECEKSYESGCKCE